MTEHAPVWPEQVYVFWSAKIAKGERTLEAVAVVLELERTRLWYRLRKRGLATAREGRGRELTGLEAKVQRLAGLGMTNQEIGERLGKTARNVSVLKSKGKHKLAGTWIKTINWQQGYYQNVEKPRRSASRAGESRTDIADAVSERTCPGLGRDAGAGGVLGSTSRAGARGVCLGSGGRASGGD